MKIVIGSDHAGLELKKELIETFASEEPIRDLGCWSPESTNYPEWAHKVAEEVKKENCFGILICGTGLGMTITANRHQGIRAALCGDCLSAEMARAHNNANILCLGSRVVGVELAKRITKVFLTTKFEEGRHQARVNLIERGQVIK